MTLKNYLKHNKKQLEICYNELAKIKNICPCKKSSITNYDQTLTEKWHNCWTIIHEFPLNLPCEVDKYNSKFIYDFFNREISKIPCFECRSHYFEYIHQNPIEKCRSLVELFTWTTCLHNNINSRNNKKILSKEEIYNIFNS